MFVFLEREMLVISHAGRYNFQLPLPIGDKIMIGRRVTAF